MKKLPIGIQTFSTIIDDNYCYVDKTPLIANLVDQGRFYFLSRPRRFGKSLLIDTIADAFLGKKALFKGLFLESNWDWDITHPVIRVDFAQGVIKTLTRLEDRMLKSLSTQAEQSGIILSSIHVDDCFEELIQKLSQQTGKQVVVLVDEYDKPILDNLSDTDTARELRDALRNFYSVLKAQGAHLRFVMLTGVSKFSKVSLFSGLNNLEDITLDPRFGTLCGYTQQELETTFHDHLKTVDLAEIKKWYNGYNFLSESVYNPFDVLLFLRNHSFQPYWFETGTPTFLIRMIRENKIPAESIEGLKISHHFLGSFDVDNINPQPLLFQAGYLTIKETIQLPAGVYYTLGFPNHEVKYAFNDALLTELTRSNSETGTQLKLYDALKTNNIDQMKQLFHAFFASIPHDWYRKNDMAGYEGYYSSIVYCYFSALGLDVRVEEATNHGKLDMAVHFNDRIYIIEFKVNELTHPARALDQIKQKKYPEKYQGKETWLIGIEFSKKDRNITRFEWEKVTC